MAHFSYSQAITIGTVCRQVLNSTQLLPGRGILAEPNSWRVEVVKSIQLHTALLRTQETQAGWGSGWHVAKGTLAKDAVPPM